MLTMHVIILGHVWPIAPALRIMWHKGVAGFAYRRRACQHLLKSGTTLSAPCALPEHCIKYLCHCVALYIMVVSLQCGKVILQLRRRKGSVSLCSHPAAMGLGISGPWAVVGVRPTS